MFKKFKFNNFYDEFNFVWFGVISMYFRIDCEVISWKLEFIINGRMFWIEVIMFEGCFYGIDIDMLVVVEILFVVSSCLEDNWVYMIVYEMCEFMGLGNNGDSYYWLC